MGRGLTCEDLCVTMTLEGGMGKKRKMIYNPWMKRYEFVDDDMDIQYNEFEREYEFGRKERNFNQFSGKYTTKGKSLKYNPFTDKYEMVPDDWVVRYNPFSGKYEFGPEED